MSPESLELSVMGVLVWPFSVWELQGNTSVRATSCHLRRGSLEPGLLGLCHLQVWKKSPFCLRVLAACCCWVGVSSEPRGAVEAHTHCPRTHTTLSKIAQGCDIIIHPHAQRHADRWTLTGWNTGLPLGDACTQTGLGALSWSGC